ncbi:acyl transferase/acyl hydrolase/lysophospholipase [Thamnidium elegans]|nr:acyl transferase/acyl hydrolase/lysophospholipase [Thamnidium elegans]
MTSKNSSLITKSISTNSKVALATLITVSVLGTVYYRTRNNNVAKDRSVTAKTKKELIDKVDNNSLYNDFVAALPDNLVLDSSADDFLSNLFSQNTSDYLTSVIPTSFEELKTKLSSLYPSFENQIETIREMYNSFWEFLSLEDFRRIVNESLEEDDDPVLHPEIEHDAYVREGQELSKEEVEFAKVRKLRMKAAFAFFIGVDENEVELEDIPNIGMASSGGGYRAMVSCSGYLNAMSETGILDCVLYMAGVSGSTWAMSQLYSPLTNASVSTLKDHLSSRIHTHIANLSNFLTVLNASRHNAKIILHGVIQRYYQQNGTVSLVDIFGMLLGGTLLSRKITVTAAPDTDDEDDREVHPAYSEFIEDPSLNDKNAKTVQEDDGAEVKPRLLKKNEIKLSRQRVYFEDGSLPMPIYCAVRHEIQKAGVTKAETISSKKSEEVVEDIDIEKKDTEEKNTEEKDVENKDIKEEEEEESKKESEGSEAEEEEEESSDLYQWFEFTPYDMGSEEINAWIPIWSFGRKFEAGKSIERLPEQSLGILMGMFGSAFVASLAHFYQEIRMLLPTSAIEKADEMIDSYQSSVSTIHPISPASFPNPFYKLATKVQTKDETHEEILRSESLVESEQIGLMDAGMDNNIPFYPLLRQGRDVDVILSLDLSADIQDTPFFDRAEGYVKRRGINGWPSGAGWPKQDTDNIPVVQESNNKSSEKTKESCKPTSKYTLNTCTVFESSSSETTPDKNDDSNTMTTYPENTNPITLIYFPLIVNENYDPEFDPQNAEFCSTWNFVYTSEQVNKLHELAEANVKDNLEKVRKVFKDTWKRKRDERLKRQDLSYL